MSITVNTAGGNSACLSTEFGTSPVGATCHLPLNKIVWGDDSVSHKVNETFPLPVQIMEITGEAIAFTGNMGASGSFPVINPILTPSVNCSFLTSNKELFKSLFKYLNFTIIFYLNLLSVNFLVLASAVIFSFLKNVFTLIRS